MYKFTPREEIPIDTTIPEAPPSIIIPSDVPICPAGGFYPSADSIVSARSVPPILAATHVPELRGYSDMGSTWGGSSIKSVREASGAHVEIDDTKTD
uniref:Uncharacterized protein n=1 Tax=Vitis vinifera TaxID=29760 RepID=F6HRS6_VITVI